MKLKINKKSRIHELEQQLIDYKGQVEAIGRSQAVIEFNMDGTIIVANDNFLNAVGYQLDEVQGKHHSMFVRDEVANSREYKEFWEILNRGEFQARQFRRLAKGGKEIWIQATYNPIIGENGKPFKVVKFATDITQTKRVSLNNAGQIEAIHKSQALIEFNLDGTIISANDNFLNTMGYDLHEIKGKHHSIFAEPEYAASNEYKQFWAHLADGNFHSGEFMRIAKGGKQVWIQASYNPILGLDDKPCKVVKFASDITTQKELHKTVESLLTEVNRVMTGLSAGDLTERVHGDYSGQFKMLKDAVNDYSHKISDIVLNIGETSQLVSTGADEISRGNLDLSRRTESQAASLEETSASMEEMTSTVKQNADNAREANELAISTRDQAATGGEVVNKAITAMHEINEASNKISDIIGVIDEIAFQTNLLALNAAVEAARAGEQGRGFAVVATEVRNLAGRSATAAKEIKALIEDSVQKVTDGSRLVNQSGETLEKIMDSIKQVAEIIGDISSASQEQALGIEQVNKAIIEMDTSTQQNTAMVEEAAAAAESMSEQSNQLNNLVGIFQVEKPSDPSNFAAPSKEERRSSERPWSQTSSVQSEAKNLQKNDFNIAAGSDVTDDWEEF
ncbi:MAG: methyl-accepting chemotaxis protein [Gammaproteobacteria bacterium]